MSRNHLLASLFLVLGMADLVLLNVWLVPAIWPPSSEPIATKTIPRVLERTPVKRHTADGTETPLVAGITSRPDNAEMMLEEHETSSEPTGASLGSPAQAVEPQQVAEVISKPTDTAADTEKEVEKSAGTQALITSTAVEPIPESRSSEKPSQSSAEPQSEILHHAMVQFVFGGDTLRSAARSILVATARVYKENPDAEIQVNGHTDNRGSEDYNYRLSERRARAVAMLLEAEEIPSERIQVRGHGPSQPLDIQNNAAARAKNRRVEITIRRRLP